MSKPKPEPMASLASNVQIQLRDAILDGELKVPYGAIGIVLFAHGSGSGRHSPRNQYVARVMREAGIGTLLFDLLKEKEEESGMTTGNFQFDVGLFAKRLLDVTRWIASQNSTRHLGIGYFATGTGSSAALVAASELGELVRAVVSRGGRPDLAGEALSHVKSPTLLIVGGRDKAAITPNEEAYSKLRCEKVMKIVPEATNLFEEPGALKEASRLASEWFRQHF